MDRVNKVLNAINAHIKKQCERCDYDGSGCVNQLLQEAEEIIKEVKAKGYEISEGRPVVNVNCREILRSIRHAIRDYGRATGQAPACIRMSYDVFQKISHDEHIYYSSERAFVYGVRIVIDQTSEDGLFDLPEATRGDVDGTIAQVGRH